MRDNSYENLHNNANIDLYNNNYRQTPSQDLYLNNLYKNASKVEKSLDNIIKQNMRGESSYSPLKYQPTFLDDKYSRQTLVGNNNIFNGNYYKNKNPLVGGGGFFESIPHKYLNTNNGHLKKENDKMWNLQNNNETYNYNESSLNLDKNRNIYLPDQNQNKIDLLNNNHEILNKSPQANRRNNIENDPRNYGKFATIGKNLVSSPMKPSASFIDPKIPDVNKNYNLQPETAAYSPNFHYYNYHHSKKF